MIHIIGFCDDDQNMHVVGTNNTDLALGVLRELDPEITASAADFQQSTVRWGEPGPGDAACAEPCPPDHPEAEPCLSLEQ